jgi:hypothetical protein
MDHSAVFLGGASQEIALVAGWSTGNALNATGCASAVEIITPDYMSPMNPTIRFSGTDPLEHRIGDQSAGLLAGSGNVLVAGGYDGGIGAATASAAYLQVAFDRFDPVVDMADPRRSAATVAIPGGAFPGMTEDRVYLFGGWDDSGVTLDSVEYFTE